MTTSEIKQFEALKKSLRLQVIQRDKHWAARYRGFTAYGYTETEAIAKLKEGFAFAVDSLYERGIYGQG